MSQLVFDLADWEVFVAPPGPPPAPSPTIRQVWIADEHGRIYGATDALGEPVWLHPDRVPTRVLRRDTAAPRHPDEWAAYFKASRARWLADQGRELTDDEKVARRLAAMPEPEQRGRPAALEEIPQGAKNVGVRATQAGFDCRASYARGPRTDQYWNVVETSDSIVVKGQHPDGRRFVAAWITKTGQHGAGAGRTKWLLETAYAMVDGVWTACNSSDLSAYCQSLINQ